MQVPKNQVSSRKIFLKLQQLVVQTQRFSVSDDTIVKAEIAKNKIGINFEIIHLSRSGILLNVELNFCKYFIFFKRKFFG